jgi:hypothetical protein
MNQNEEINSFSFGNSRSRVLPFKRLTCVAKTLQKIKEEEQTVNKK